MSEKRVDTPDGHFLRAIEWEGHLFAPGISDKLTNLADVRVREDDVLIVSYPKSGNHWTWEIAMRLLTSSLNEFEVNFRDYIFETRDADFLSRLPSPRVLVTHIPLQFLSRIPGLLDGRCKIVNIVRNPKDVAVSLYNEVYNMYNLYGYNGAWWGFFENFLQGEVESDNWFDHVTQWETFHRDHPSVPFHLVYYEDLKRDQLTEIKRLSEFLGVTLDEESYEMIDKQCEFSAMKKSKEAIDPPDLLALYRDGKSKIFRKGIVSDWKNFFTVGQSERFDSIFADRMKNSHLNIRFTLNSD